MEDWAWWRLWRWKAGWIECVSARQTWPDLLMDRSDVSERREREGGGNLGKKIIKDGLWPATGWRVNLF